METPLRVACIAGARPNFMKIAPIMRALDASSSLEGMIVHTGQHYDRNMSEVFFRELGIPEPAINLEVGSSTQGTQTGRIMVAFDEVFEDVDPDLVLVVGDVNSTLACALVSRHRQVPVAHVEAGLRSFDETMPEETNRVLTDRISDLLFTTEPSAAENLEREGIPAARVHYAGNTMIDTLAHMLPRIEATETLEGLGIRPPYGLVTFHRPSNVDRADLLQRLTSLLVERSRRIPLVFPVHPRTRKRLVELDLWGSLEAAPGLLLLEPLPYTRFMGLVRESTFVLTDSGGIQEETTWLGIPCLTQRTSTERPITVDEGTNTLLGDDLEATERAIDRILAGEYETGSRPSLWDGHAAERIVAVIESWLRERR